MMLVMVFLDINDGQEHWSYTHEGHTCKIAIDEREQQHRHVGNGLSLAESTCLILLAIRSSAHNVKRRA